MASPDDEQQHPPILDEVKRRRKTLHDSLVHLEEATSSPAAGRIPQWTAQVLKEMGEIREAFDQHILVTEKPDGLYEEILQRAPRLEHGIGQLKEEHPEISRAIDEMRQRLETTEIDGEWSIDKARDDLQRFIGRVIRHRQKGADLVWEAYNVDIGGIE
jgi:hemerythrin-like domain-containing protein